jgi:hypothetical protein
MAPFPYVGFATTLAGQPDPLGGPHLGGKRACQNGAFRIDLEVGSGAASDRSAALACPAILGKAECDRHNRPYQSP